MSASNQKGWTLSFDFTPIIRSMVAIKYSPPKNLNTTARIAPLALPDKIGSATMYADFKTEWKGAGMADITDRLIVKKENGVGRIMLDNQARRNAMTFEMWQSLPSALDDFMADDNVRVIVVSGKGGKAFCAGADISQFEKNRSSE